MKHAYPVDALKLKGITTMPHYIIRNRFGQVEGVAWNMRNAAEARREYVRRGFMDVAPKGTRIRKATAKEADAAEKGK